VRVSGPVTVADRATGSPLIRHRSNPLRITLKRFNVYSNNDIVRLADGRGGVGTVAAFTAARLGVDPAEVELATASGEGRNRLSARTVVALLRAFRAQAAEHGLGPDDLLPVPGCDPGPVPRMFPRLASGERARATALKTGTLRSTDGGVAVLAGYFTSPDRGEVFYCIGATRAGDRLRHFRAVEERWLLDLMATAGGAAPRACDGELPLSDTAAEVEVVATTQNDSP
jgi:D-alanyl-D-alanine carboxypeptidase